MISKINDIYLKSYKDALAKFTRIAKITIFTKTAKFAKFTIFCKTINKINEIYS